MSQIDLSTIEGITFFSSAVTLDVMWFCYCCGLFHASFNMLGSVLCRFSLVAMMGLYV